MPFITASWPAPAHIKTAISVRKASRHEGKASSHEEKVSSFQEKASSYVKKASSSEENAFSDSLGAQSQVNTSVYGTNNLALHVGDEVAHVANNRQLLATETGVEDWAWLKQVHSAKVEPARAAKGLVDTAEADASITSNIKLACVVLTADCVPVLLCDQAGEQVAAVHAGWKGLVGNILRATIAQFRCPPEQILAYIGPCIGPEAYEVDEPFRQRVFTAWDGQLGRAQLASLFQTKQDKPKHFQFDLIQATKFCLQEQGINAIFGGDICCYSDLRFYSYRRNPVTGRFASAIWKSA